MRGYGEAAKTHRSEGGSAQVGRLDTFRSRAIEEERHKGDDNTPAVMRLVSRFPEDRQARREGSSAFAH